MTDSKTETEKLVKKPVRKWWDIWFHCDSDVERHGPGVWSFHVLAVDAKDAIDAATTDLSAVLVRYDVAHLAPQYRVWKVDESML